MTALKWAKEICHMAEHGYDSVESYLGDSAATGVSYNHPASYTDNPTTCPNMQWRIKPDTLTISATIPRPLPMGTLGNIDLIFGGSRIGFNSVAERDEAERILVDALRGVR